MSLILKGIDMPKDGELHLIITKNGIICGAEYPNKIKHTYPLNLEAEAIQIPKDHGRIVDINNVEVEEDVYYQCYRVDAPTILEAENSDG